jgi:hypothetical protein
MKLHSTAKIRGDWLGHGAVPSSLVLLAVVTAQLAAVPPCPAESVTISRMAADELAAKIATLTKSDPRGSGPLPPVTITDNEATSYLRFHGHEFLPAAVRDPEIHIQPDQISGAADVDFDELGQMGGKSDDWTAKLFTYVFKGKQRVTAAGKLETANGEGKFALTSLSVGTTSLPAGFVNFLLQSYIEREYKIDLSKPFPLPPNVSHIELGSGRATLRRIALSRR